MQTRTCEACKAKTNEVAWLRRQVEQLQDRLFIEQGPPEIRLAARAEMTAGRGDTDGEGSDQPDRVYQTRPQVPPAVLSAIDEMSAGDAELFESMERWAAKALAVEGADPERIADLIYSGADPLIQTEE